MAFITPEFIQTFETKLNAVYGNAWRRVLEHGLWWDRIAVRRQSSTSAEQFEWMLETAKIYRTGSKGTELRFDDIVSIPHEIQNENFGSGLRIPANDFKDDRYGYAAQWATQVGDAGAYHPQAMIVDLLLNGTSRVGYDGKPFFSDAHPVNPYDRAAGTFANVFTGRALTAQNVAWAVAQIAKVRQPNGAPRRLRPSILLVDPSNAYEAAAITGAEIITDPMNVSGGAPATNMIKRAYGFAEPIVADELSDEPGVWYLAVEAYDDALQGAFVYQEREPFVLTTYQDLSEAQLSRMRAFEYHLLGRSAAAYAHPYLIFRFEPPTQASGGGGGDGGGEGSGGGDGGIEE